MKKPKQRAPKASYVRRLLLSNAVTAPQSKVGARKAASKKCDTRTKQKAKLSRLDMRYACHSRCSLHATSNPLVDR
jgi:hypothetical protein